jgi:hypothetical protein
MNAPTHDAMRPPFIQPLRHPLRGLEISGRVNPELRSGLYFHRASGTLLSGNLGLQRRDYSGGGGGLSLIFGTRKR